MKGTLHNLLVLLLVAAPTATQAQSGSGDGYDYNINASNTNTITITFDYGAGGPVTIPMYINGLLVTSIGSSAFFDLDNVTSATIPGTVTTIGGVAFDGSGLTNATLSCGLLCIGAGAFLYTSLTNITIPASVTNIGTSAFSCFSMAAITVDARNSYYSSSNGILFDKNQTTLVAFPGSIGGSYTVPVGVLNVGDGAFAECASLTSITIPDGVTNIAYAAFWQCLSLTNITIPDSVTSIGEAAFALFDSPGLTNLTIGSGVTNIGDDAFYYNDAMANIYFRGNAPAVGADGFNPYYDTVYYLPGTTGWDAFAASTGLSPVLWNPLIQTGDGSFGVCNNQFGFNITGTTNIPIVVEACDNLASPVWTPLTNVSLPNGSFYFSEPVQSNGSSRYYRISSP